MSYLLSGCVWFARLPSDLNRPSCKAILARIADAANHDGKAARGLTNTWIAEDVGLSASQVRRWLKKLSAIGLISIERGCGRGNLSSHSIFVEKLVSFTPDHLVLSEFKARLNDASSNTAITSARETKRWRQRRKRVAPMQQKGAAGAYPLQTLQILLLRALTRRLRAPAMRLQLPHKRRFLRNVSDAEGFLASRWHRVRHVEPYLVGEDVRGYVLHVDAAFAVELIARRLEHYRFRVVVFVDD